MTTIAESVQHLFPSSIPNLDWYVSDSPNGPYLHGWNAAKLGPQPDTATINAVTQAQIDNARLVRLRDQAKQFFAAEQRESAVIRAFMLLVLDELNSHTAKTNAILTAIDNSTNYATLKTNIAAVTDLPIRTAQQLRTAIQNKIDAGDADT